MDDRLQFTAQCQKCTHTVTHSYDKATLRRLLDEPASIEFYCINCNATRNLDSDERMALRMRLTIPG
jgi:hypothetical protein